eukprot:CAMPEP_0197525538 /NCGR_PEP_ID=MMETSP1318-20131121/12859_1 /TAXON_ID=552666 /ORGANISM="Partenskyella glossopodia, Strain RCC365" /LENGTH=262 /DNA_ID=CAMNT_0043079051 /DNA_START=59 /DNA_END=847 /DNA_ORIENTATION=-
MSAILNPANGYRGQLERKGIKPKNHHKDNLRKIKQKQMANRMSKEMIEDQKRQAKEEKHHRLEKYAGVESEVAKTMHSAPKKGRTFLRKNSKPALVTARAKTPYISKKVKTKPGLPEFEKKSNKDIYSKKNYISQNRSAAAVTKTRTPKTKQRATANKNFGKIPDYIIERKIELARKKEAERLAASENRVPPGMILLSEEQRLETLRKLQAGKEDVENELARFPLVVETISRKKAKKALENKMKEIEDAIKVFSQERVLIEE